MIIRMGWRFLMIVFLVDKFVFWGYVLKDYYDKIFLEI